MCSRDENILARIGKRFHNMERTDSSPRVFWRTLTSLEHCAAPLASADNSSEEKQKTLQDNYSYSLINTVTPVSYNYSNNVTGPLYFISSFYKVTGGQNIVDYQIKQESQWLKWKLQCRVKTFLWSHIPATVCFHPQSHSRPSSPAPYVWFS